MLISFKKACTNSTQSKSMQLTLTPKVILMVIAYTAPQIAIAANEFSRVKKTFDAVDADKLGV